MLLLLMLLPIRCTEELRFCFLWLADLLRLRLELLLAREGLGGDFPFLGSRPDLGGSCLCPFGLSFYLER